MCSSDLFDGIFGGRSPPQQTRVRGRHARQGRPATVQGDSMSDWTANFGGHYARGGNLIASFYGHGERLSRHTASGQVFNPHGFTAAHRSYPFGTVLRVCHHGCVNVTVNDRGPFVRGRSLDLSYGAARAIGMGSTRSVHVERLN